MNCSLTVWLFENQDFIRKAVFVAGFMAIQFGMDTLKELHYKLQRIGNEISGPSYMYEDKMSIVYNLERLEKP